MGLIYKMMAIIKDLNDTTFVQKIKVNNWDVDFQMVLKNNITETEIFNIYNGDIIVSGWALSPYDQMSTSLNCPNDFWTTSDST